MRLSQILVSSVASLLLLFDNARAHSESRNPLNYITLIENARIHTPLHRVHAFSEFDLTFDLHAQEQRLKLTLEPNHDILGEDSHVEFLDANGNVRHAEKIDREAHKVFQGTSWILEDTGRWRNVGWSRIVIRRDGDEPLFEGAFTVLGDHHHIQLKSNYMATKHVLDPAIEDHRDEYMTVFRDSDVGRQPKTELRKRNGGRSCAADSLPFNTDPNHPVFRTELKREAGTWGSMSLPAILGKRQIDSTPGSGNSAGTNLRQTIGSTAGCPSTRKVALVGVATDCTYTASFNSTESVRQNVITQINSASDLFQKTFNITLGLRNLTVSDAQCPGTPPASAPWNLDCGGGTTITDRLNLFSQWRGQRDDGNAFWTLLSTCNTGPEVGLAWLGQLCSIGVTTGQASDQSSQSVTGANVVVRTSTEWQVIAHESGHTFGAVHDCDGQSCADSDTVNSQQCCPLSSGSCDASAQFIMNPSSTPGVTEFSPCTVGNICSAMGRNSVRTNCLSDNRDVKTLVQKQCGNGIVEDGEECDCGGPDGCGDNPCCDGATCQFKQGAVCDDNNEGCCRNCQFARAGAVCRASTGSCDPEETCSGTNAFCPTDATAPDGTKCSNGADNNLRCASGQCTSRDLQCKTLMGSFTQGNDTYACNSQFCMLSCASPEFGLGVCYSMQQNFLDGTPCGGGGRCNNGACKGSTFGGEVGSWIGDHKTIVIAVSSVVGGLLLLSIVGCVWRRCIRPRPNRPRQAHRVPGYNPATGWDGPRPPMQQRGSWRPQQAGFDPSGTPNVGWRPPQPQAPPPIYEEYSGRRGVRYA